MGKLFRTCKHAIDWLLEQAVIFAVLILVLDVLWGVLTRFLLNSPSRWTEEVATFMLIWVSLLGAAVAYDRQEHLGVDYFVMKLTPGAQRVLAAVVELVVLAFVVAAMVYGGYVLVTETLQAGQRTPALGVEMGYVYLAVPLSGTFIAVSCLERIITIAASRELPADTPTDPPEIA